MNLRFLAILGLTAGVLFSGTGQAHAMGLLVAVGNPQIQVVVSQDGSLKMIQTAEKRIEVSTIDTASVQDIKIEK